MIIALNTSLADLHIGLFSDDAESHAEFHQKASPDDRHIHDALLAQETSGLLKKIDADAKDISKIALIIGPGSFTGLRIGLSFAKGLAFGSGAKIIPLKAHSVLLAGYKRAYSVSDATAILYPGYESHKTYMSYTSSPEDISYVEIAELKNIGIKKIICPPELEEIEFTKTVIPIDMKMMAQMTIDDRLSTIDVLADLEPFYGSDFKIKL